MYQFNLSSEDDNKFLTMMYEHYMNELKEHVINSKIKSQK